MRRSHTLRYVLKNRATGDVIFVVLFTLYLKEDIDEEGNVKEGVEGNKKIHHGSVDGDAEAEKEVKEEVQGKNVATNDDDVD